jgi:hypothetical protein
VPTFCRHNRLIQNCPICSREHDVEARPIVSSRAGRVEPQPRAPRSGTPRRNRSSPGAGVTVRRLRTSVDDGYRSSLVPGLKSSDEAVRLAEELAFSARRLSVLEEAPPGLYAEVASGPDTEERAWLAFLIAYLCPLDGEDPFAGIRSARTSWRSGELPLLDDVPLGPRTAHDPARGTATIVAYRAWAGRYGSQAGALTGEAGWTPERRFGRIYERLALPGLHRGARFDFLVTLGRLGVAELQASGLMLSGSDEATVAAKRALGIGDSLLLERRAQELAHECQLPLDALDLGFYNWERGARASMGLPEGSEPDPVTLAAARGALGLM